MRRHFLPTLRAVSLAGIPRMALACALLVACSEGMAPTASITDVSTSTATIQQQVAIVNAFGCAVIRGGNVTRPAGSQILIVQGWETKNQGLLSDYLRAQTTTLSINGGQTIDVSQAYSAPVQLNSSYESIMTYDTGTTLAAGETLSFILTIALSHQLQDGFSLVDDDTHRPLFFGPGVAFQFPCTVTAV